MVYRTLIVFISGCSGVVIGFLGAVWLFAIDVDLLAVPYLNQPEKTTQEVVVVQDSLSVAIPKGATVIHKSSPKGLPIYALEFVGDLSTPSITQPSETRQYFYVQPSKP